MILLLGASGYIGQAFARELERRGIDVVPLSRKQVDYKRFGAFLAHESLLRLSIGHCLDNRGNERKVPMLKLHAILSSARVLEEG